MRFRHQPLLFVALLSSSAACNAPPSSTVDASVTSDSGTPHLAALTVTVPPVAIAALAEVTDEFCLPLGNRDALFVTGFELRAGPYLHHTQTRLSSLDSTSPESCGMGTL